MKDPATRKQPTLNRKHVYYLRLNLQPISAAGSSVLLIRSLVSLIPYVTSPKPSPEGDGFSTEAVVAFDIYWYKWNYGRLKNLAQLVSSEKVCTMKIPVMRPESERNNAPL